MRVGVLGSGDVGRALATGFASLGHEVKLGTREPKNDKVRLWVAKTGARASAGSFDEVAKFGELLVLATAWSGTENALRLAGIENFAGKTVIDVTNPLASSPGKPPYLAISGNDSGGEQVQRWLPGARVVKAFNIVGNASMVNPKFPNGPPDMFLCGDDAAAKEQVTGICTAFGWPAIDIGGIEGARLLESLAMLWITVAIRTEAWNHAFKLLRT